MRPTTSSQPTALKIFIALPPGFVGSISDSSAFLRSMSGAILHLGFHNRRRSCDRNQSLTEPDLDSPDRKTFRSDLASLGEDSMFIDLLHEDPIARTEIVASRKNNALVMLPSSCVLCSAGAKLVDRCGLIRFLLISQNTIAEGFRWRRESGIMAL
jgi:hypothetical protein